MPLLAEVGVGVLDVKGQVPNDARLAEMGVQVVDLPDDSPVFLVSLSHSLLLHASVPHCLVFFFPV